MAGIQELLINLLVVVVSILFIQYLMNKQDLDKAKFELIAFFFLSIAIILCINFPFTISHGFLFDLRFIPFLLGCFYASRTTGLGLALVIILTRFIHGGDGVWITLVLTPIFFMITLALYPLFQRSRIRIRIILQTIIIIIISLSILIALQFVYKLAVPVHLWYSFIGTQILGMLLGSYMAETIRSQQYLLRRLIRMEKVEVVSHLAASISHEVRNPLTSTRGFLQLVQESSRIPDQEKGYINIAITEIDRAEEIIKDYLTFAKPTVGRMDKLDVQDTVAKAMDIIRPLSNMNSVELISDVGDCYLKGNESLFNQMIINLLKNSIEAMPSGGVLKISGFEIDDQVIITIADQGVGMSPSQLNRLGEPYFSTKESKGTGLGMMVVYRVVESMKGTIKINSTVGEGTEVELRFPVG